MGEQEVRKWAEWRIEMGYVTNGRDCEGIEAHDNIAGLRRSTATSILSVPAADSGSLTRISSLPVRWEPIGYPAFTKYSIVPLLEEVWNLSYSGTGMNNELLKGKMTNRNPHDKSTQLQSIIRASE
jgi:hypothetical protein